MFETLFLFFIQFAFAQPAPVSIAPQLSIAEDLEVDTRRAVDIGHNVTATAWTLKGGTCTVGLQVIGCGVTDRLSFATSTYLYTYRMASLAARYLLKEDGPGRRWALQVDYFKTYMELEPGWRGGYDMEAVWVMLLRTIRLKKDYHLHLNLHTNYYFEEKMPFSLRRPYMDSSTRFQLNIMSMHEIDLVHNWVIKGELGLVDALRSPAHFHSGVTIGRRTNRFHWHFGFSMTSTVEALFDPINRSDYQQYLRFYDPRGYNTPDKDEFRIRHDFSIHPEVSLQYFF